MTNLKLGTLSHTQITQLFGPIRNLTLLAIRHANILYIPSVISEMTNLEMLSLHDNLISHWHPDTFNGMTRLTYINLSNNKITVINDTSFCSRFLERVQTMLLIYNPISCTCDNYWFIQWAKENKRKLNYQFPDQLKCYSPPRLNDRPIAMYDPLYLECHGLEQYQLAIVSAGSVLVIIIILIVLYKRYKWHIKYYMYLMHSKRETQNMSYDGHYRYDAFVAYVSYDRHWVLSNLMAKLEGELGYKLCLHERDFLPGQTILDQISQTIQHSRKVILVLSDNFAKSQWCQYEILLAQHRLMEDGGNVLILIMLEEIRGKYMTNCLSMLLRTMTYTKWTTNPDGKKLFWNKITLAMK